MHIPVVTHHCSTLNNLLWRAVVLFIFRHNTVSVTAHSAAGALPHKHTLYTSAYSCYSAHSLLVVSFCIHTALHTARSLVAVLSIEHTPITLLLLLLLFALIETVAAA
jgi:hypothetical protein